MTTLRLGVLRFRAPSGLEAFFFLFFFSFVTVKALSNLLLLILVGIWLIGWFKADFRQGYWVALKESPVVWFLLALTVMIVVHTWGSAGTPEWIAHHLRKYARLLYAVLLIMLLIPRPDWQRSAMMGFVAAMLFVLVSTWLNLWFVLPWSATQVTGWGHSHHVFGDYITQSIMMSLFVAIALMFAIESQHRGQTLLWVAIVILASVSITHLSLGRTGVLTLMVSLGTAGLLLVPRRWAFLAVLGGVAALGLILLSSETMVSRWALALQELDNWRENTASSIGHRLFNYETALALMLEKPWWGHGTGAFHTEICRFVTPESECGRFNWHPHNQFLFIGIDHGLIGVLLYLTLITSLFRAALQSVCRTPRVVLACLASILTMNSMINSPLWSSIESQFFMFMAALLVSMSWARQPTSARQ
ncbi:MAG: hypothetical protein RLZZ344_1748 [Pseudomonadota bacterium]|jgi:O-antigen ligase